MHPDLEKVVTCVVEKSDGKGGKETIMKYLKKKDDMV